MLVKRIGLWLVATAVVLVLLFSYRTSTSGAGGKAVAVAPQSPGAVGVVPAPTGSSHSISPKTPDQSATMVNGSVANTMWGPVQVQVKIGSGKITDVITLVHPTGTGRDQTINSYALPKLRLQALKAQGADISGVSGATVTSDGYRESLQAALDAAHFGK
jgi:uncharacterized protein with FMN-binding domain